MSSPEITMMAALVQRARLADDLQVDECLNELEPGRETVADFLRILERKGYLTSWQSSKLLKGDTDGYYLGGYRILYKIAAGSFGRVFRADDPASGTIVAIKVLRNKWMEDTKKIDLFYREGKVGMTLQHPNIVRILSVGKDPATSKHFIVMEFVEGGNLRDILKIRKRLSAKEAVDALEECANGLAYAITRGLTHRDIKPTNILVSSQGAYKLVDFGLAELAGEGAGDDDTEVDRTVDYAALERATNVKAGDPRSDIYFLGCVFYEMLTGRRPLAPTKDKHALRTAHRFAEIPPIAPGEVDAPPAVFKLLDRMMAFHPHERFQTASHLHEAVRRVQAELEGKKADVITPSGPKTVYVVEGNEKIQDALRDKLKRVGYRVLISHDPERAVSRYKEMPFHALVMDAGTAGEDGLAALKLIIRQAEDEGLLLASVLILSEEQATWAREVEGHAGVGVLVRPITLHNLTAKLAELGRNQDAAG
jgi:serine/threonine protein kinase